MFNGKIKQKLSGQSTEDAVLSVHQQLSGLSLSNQKLRPLANVGDVNKPSSLNGIRKIVPSVGRSKTTITSATVTTVSNSPKSAKVSEKKIHQSMPKNNFFFFQSLSAVRMNSGRMSTPKTKVSKILEFVYIIININIWQTPTIAAVPDGMSTCNVCGRNFNADRLDKHQAICQKAAAKKRKVFDATIHRVKVKKIAIIFRSTI